VTPKGEIKLQGYHIEIPKKKTKDEFKSERAQDYLSPESVVLSPQIRRPSLFSDVTSPAIVSRSRSASQVQQQLMSPLSSSVFQRSDPQKFYEGITPPDVFAVSRELGALDEVVEEVKQRHWKHDLCFKLVPENPNGRVYVFFADNQLDYQEWLYHIAKVLGEKYVAKESNNNASMPNTPMKAEAQNKSKTEKK
jgi:hypothetical protein